MRDQLLVKVLEAFSLHTTNIISDFFWFPEFSVSVDTWLINVMMVVVLSVGFNFKQVVCISLVLFSIMLSHDVEFGCIIVDTFL